jgi:glycosyltransferase involved in cell wall biosynthesis
MKKVLLVAMADSIHTARWLEQFRGADINFVLFPSSPHRRVHPRIERMLESNSGVNLTLSWGLRMFSLPLWLIDRFVDNRLRGLLLRRMLRREQPEIVHAMETQNAGYVMRRALRKSVTRPRVILTIWGSDLFWFRQFPRHKRKLKETLKLVDDLALECNRDVAIAHDLGYEGRVIPPFPITGGYNVEGLSKIASIVPPSQRKVILVKGHTRFVGRAELALKALEQVRDLLGSYRVVVYSADPKARRLSRKLSTQYSLDISLHRRGALTQDQVINSFSEARIYLGISLSDGLPNSLQEAMVLGAFPIQTNTSCADEWIVDGESGFIVDPHNPTSIVSALRKALENDALVDTAAVINLTTSRQRLSIGTVFESIHDFYHV